jgi:hypothetical protein
VESERETRCDEAVTQVREARVDFSSLAPIDKLERTPTGGIRVPANIGRDGLLRYQRADGSVRIEFRPPEEAFAAASLESVADAVVTVGHPPDALVTPRTVRQYGVGHVRGPGARDGSHVVAQLAVLDASAIDRIATRDLVEISSGYTCLFEPTPGTTANGERYDGVQRSIRYNHVALLPAGAGRAGRDVKLRFDGAEVRLEPEEPELQTRNDAMKETIDGREYTVGSAEWALAHAKRLARLDELEKDAKEGDDLAAKVDELTKARSALEKELADAKTKIDELTKKLGEPMDEKKMDSLVAERSSVLDAARRILGPDAKLEGKSNDALRREAITKLDGAAALLEGGKERSAEAVRVYFEARVRSMPAQTPLRADSLGGAPTPGAPTVDVSTIYTPPGRR